MRSSQLAGEPRRDQQAAIGHSGAMDRSPPDGIEAALSRLADLDTAPLPEHAAVYEQVHADLRSALDSRSVADPPPLG